MQSYLDAVKVTTIQRIKAVLLEKHGLKLGKDAIRSMLSSVRYSRKRTSKRLNSRTEPDPSRVTTFVSEVLPALQNDRLVVSLDECYFSEKVLPLYGYSPIGTKCVVTTPQASWQQRSLLLAVDSNGSTHHCVFQGAVNKLRFHQFVESMPHPPGTTILLDNVRFHLDRTPFDRKGYIPAFTPPYSPQFNPVENVFSKVKGLFRSEWPWLPGGVDAAVDDAVRRVTVSDIRNCFGHLKNLLQDLKRSGDDIMLELSPDQTERQGIRQGQYIISAEKQMDGCKARDAEQGDRQRAAGAFEPPCGHHRP